MLRSLFAGISGMRVNQTMLDVTGNNIANANTIGFKSSTTVFQDTLSQMLTAASAPNANTGGTNAIQIGLGVQLAATTGNFSQGSEETTGGQTDMMIQGDGFFVVKDGNQQLYTRAGSFHWDPDGTLCAPDGKRVQGYLVDNTGKATGGLVDLKLDAANAQPAPAAGSKMQSYNIGADGKINAVFDDGTQSVLGQIAIADFTNPQGLTKSGDTQFTQSASSGNVQLGVAGQGSRGNLTVGSLEMSNVDLAAEFTNLILAQRGFEASSKVITTSDQVLQDLVNIKQ